MDSSEGWIVVDRDAAKGAQDEAIHTRVVRVVETIDQIAVDQGVSGETRADRFKKLQSLIGARARGQLIHLEQYSVPRPQTLRMVADVLRINIVPLYMEMGWIMPLEVRETAVLLGETHSAWGVVDSAVSDEDADHLANAIQGGMKLSDEALEAVAEYMSAQKRLRDAIRADLKRREDSVRPGQRSQTVNSTASGNQ